MAMYPDEELAAIYELGRMYYEMGYFLPAERIFSGLLAIDEQKTAARLGLGLVKLENRFYEEAASHFKLALQKGHFPVHAQLGLAASFVGLEEIARAKQILLQLAPELETTPSLPSDIRSLWEALALRCDVP